MYRMFYLFLIALSLLVIMPAHAASVVGIICKPQQKNILIDNVWGGASAKFSAIENDSFIYSGYYDDSRWLTVSQFNKCNGDIKKVQINSQFTGWDAHNYVELAFDNEGRLHIAANMHSSPLVYAYMSIADELTSLQDLKEMTGLDEERTTYPKFFRLFDGALAFSYRSGISGDGKEIINRFDGKKWSRWLDQPLFASASTALTVNAYHTDYIHGADGFYHVAWVWRDTPNVETNFYVNYAKSRDLKKWFDTNDHELTLPLTPNNSEIVDNVPQKSGLFNNIELGFDDHGQVVISYLKFDAKGATQLYQARKEFGVWKIYQSTDWTYRWDFKGGGTITSEISFSDLSFREGMILQRVHQPEVGNVTLNYRSSDLKIQKIIKNYVWEQRPSVKRDQVRGAVLNIQSVVDKQGNPVPYHAVSWYSMPNSNHDKPRECLPALADCNYKYELQLHMDNAY